MTSDSDADKSETPASHHRRHPLDALFHPSSVAVIGATEAPGSVGRTALWNLISSPFGGTVFPVSEGRPSVLGIRACSRIADIPDPPELAVITGPAASVSSTIRECGEAGVRVAVVLSAGFREAGDDGRELERDVLDVARRHGVRIVGPNSLGVMRPATGLNATSASAMAQSGSVAFISQSSALCAAVLDWSLREHVGFSAFVSIGSMLDIGWGDFIDYLGHDPRTRSIVMYMESVGHARAFLSAAREIALAKPIIVLKVGRTQAAARAVASHTGFMTGDDDVLDAVFRRCGVLRVDTISDLFHLSEVLAKQPRPSGPRLTIITNAGGPGVLATDALIGHGGRLAELSADTLRLLDEALPASWNRRNPIDLQGDATVARYAAAVGAAVKDEGSDGVLVVLAPQAATDPAGTAERLASVTAHSERPILASWMGGAEVAAGEAVLNRANVPTFSYPDTAARIFTYMWRYSTNLKALYETPLLPADHDDLVTGRRGASASLLERVRAAGRTQLTEYESKQLLALYDIPVVATRVARNEIEAVSLAEALGYPVVLKLHSETVMHKARVGGVILNVVGADGVRAAYRHIRASVLRHVSPDQFLGVTVQSMIVLRGIEIILGSALDAQFGPVLLFGAGGQYAEVLRDRALGLPPLNTTLAKRMMEQTRVHALFNAPDNPDAPDVDAMAELLVRFSHLVADQPWIREIEVNPVHASAEGLMALDARVVVHGRGVDRASLPVLAIRPYPTKYVWPFVLRNGSRTTIRPIRPEDEPLMVDFHARLSEQSVYHRYFHAIRLGQRVAHERLMRVCFIDYDRDMALVAESRDAAGQPQVQGVGRLTKLRGQPVAEFAIVVSDEVQGLGVGSELLRRLVLVGRDEGLERIIADILPDNRSMQVVSEKTGFTCRYAPDEGVIKAELVL